MSTIAINLLPHRALKRAQRRRDFFVLAGLTAGAAFLLVVLIGGVIQGYVVAQQAKNEYIKQKNTELDKQIAEVASLRQEIDAIDLNAIHTPLRPSILGDFPIFRRIHQAS